MRALVLALLAVAGCQQPAHSPQPPLPFEDDETRPYVPPEGGVRPDPTKPAVTPCEVMCEHLNELGCQEGKPTPAGEPCVSWCTRIQSRGKIDLHPDCVSRVSRCSDVGHCAGN